MKCQSNECMNTATMLVFWPGASLYIMCPAHVAQAMAIAEAMGFVLQTQQVDRDPNDHLGGVSQ